MDIIHLKYFLQLCQDKSFSKASKQLYISQQGLSMAIIRMEKELGEKLFLRTSNGLILTKGGEFLKIRAEKIMVQFRECEDYFHMDTGKNGHINVGSVYNVIGRFPPNVQKIFFQETPHFSLQISEGVSGDIEKMVENETCALGFCLAPIDSPNLDAQFLFRRRYCFIVNRAHPLARFDSISVKQLQNEKLLVMNSKFKIHSILRHLCRQNGFEPNYIFESDRLEIFYNMVRNNPTLIAHSLDCYSFNDNDPQIKTIYLNDCDLFWDVYLIQKKGKKLSRSEELFKQKLLTEFENV